MFLFGHGHFLIFPPLAAIGAGLQAVACQLEGETVIGTVGVSMVVCLLVVALAPIVSVIGYETLGDRHVAEVVDRL